MAHRNTAAGHTALLQAAREEFAECGYAGASIRSIAERAGLSMSVLYHYYKSKQQLLEAIILETIDAYFSSSEAELATAGNDPVERLSAAVAGAIRFRVASPARADLPEREQRNLSAGFLELYHKRFEDMTGLFRGPIEAGIADRIFRTPYPDEARRAIIAMCNAVGDWYRPSGALTIDQVIDRHTEFALALLQHQPKPSATKSPPAAEHGSRQR
jgi:AcrR family transcriptional regulator